MSAKAQRRRGPELDEAILDAVWHEIITKGYGGLTLDSAASRAGTSRPVIHRRWKSRSELVVAALARYVARNPINVTDQGSVRSEMISLLQGLSERAQPHLIRILFDMREDLLKDNIHLADLPGRIGEQGLVADILARGAQRGEIDPSRITPRIISLPTDLARHDMLMTLRPLSDTSIKEIIDEVFLPLVLRTSK
ncbi:TetR/AcrR family transcriptional regulator [Brucella sp. BE17]|uniref:TetR/AcrR family transcriptional regulator n=1 Tax=Brucella sp. BE17 TaxID=3142977 RepID=UPI0031B9CB47